MSASSKRGVATGWLGWLIAAASLATVIVFATHFAEPRDFARMLREAVPAWIAVALIVQAATYLATGQVWRDVAHTAGVTLGLRPAMRIALAKLFVDQALPWGGVGGGMLLASALERRRLTRPVVAATIIVNLASYYAAYAVCLAAAIAIVAAEGQASALVVVPAIGFVGLASAIAVGVIALSRTARTAPKLFGIRRAQRWLADADRRLTVDRHLLARATGWQIAIVVLDGATLWALLQSLGVAAPIAGVFASYMIASLARTVSVIPGGLGVFEAISIVSLQQLGVPVAVALSATLLFRGVSFWLPMLPGFVASRAAA